MTSSVPIVRQVAWFSVVPQLALLAMLVSLSNALNFGNPLFVSAIFYLSLSFMLRFFVPRAHRKGISLFKQERFAEALPYFRSSYDFFSRHNWVDRWRSITILSSSRISYREMALLNIAFCLGQTGQQKLAVIEYQRVLKEFPGSKLAETALRMLGENSTSTQSDAPASDGAAS